MASRLHPFDAGTHGGAYAKNTGMLPRSDGGTASRPRQGTVPASFRRGKQTTEDKRFRIGGTLTLDDLAETEVGDWKMPDFKAASTYAALQGWLIVENDVLTLTTAGLAAA